MSAKVYCNGTDIRCLKKETLTVGMSGAVVEFEFSEEWAQLNKTAVFESDGSRIVQIAGGKATVPHEILTTPGMDVLVGVYTQREDGTTWPSPTPMCKIAQLKGGAKPDGDPSYPPTPDIAQQLQNQIDKLEDKVEDLEQGGTDNGFRVQDTALVATRRKTIPDMDAEEHLGRSLRGIFADSNIVQGGDFDGGIPAIGGVEGTLTDNAPSITDGVLALDANGAGSYITLPAYTFEAGRAYYVAARFKVDEYTQGRMGVQSTQSIYAPKEPTLGAWVTVSGYLRRTAEYSGASYIGAMKEAGTGGAQPILKGYIDNVCVLDLTAIFGEGAEPGKEKMDELYALYLAALEGRRINGSFTIASLPDAGELPAEECLYRFKAAMNAKAKYIGMSGSSLISPSGLALAGTDDPFLQNNYGTAADMMKLGLACFSSEKLMQILRVYSYNGITSLVRGGALESAIAEAQYHYYGGKGGSLAGSVSGQGSHGVLNFVALCAAGDYNFVVSILGEWLYDEDGSKKSVSPLVVDALEAVYTKLTTGTAVVGEALQAAIDRAEYPVSVAACAIPAGSEGAWAMYGGASVLDGAVSWSSTPDATHALASVTKLLTALVVLDNVHDLNERVAIKASDNVGGSGTALGEGESYTYNDLLHLMLMESNNCAATALGRAVGERLLRLGVTDAVQAAAESVKVPAVLGGGGSASNLVLTSPDGTKWNVTVSNTGVITATKQSNGGDDAPTTLETYTIFVPQNVSDEWTVKGGYGELDMSTAEFLELFYDSFVSTPPSGVTVTKNSIGKDQSGQYDMWEFDFCPANYSRTILLSSGMHTYELPASFGLANFIGHLYTDTGNNAFDYIRNNVRVKVIPIINPWGFNQYPKKYGNVNGVNPNRNFDCNDGWAAFPVHSANPNDSNYNEWNVKGDTPFSEAETANLAKWVLGNWNAEFWIDCHTGEGYSDKDLWVYYLSDSKILDRINGGISRIEEWFQATYGSKCVTVRTIDSAGSIRHQWSNKCAGVQTFTLEQAPARTTFGTAASNEGADISNYSTNISTFVQELLLEKYRSNAVIPIESVVNPAALVLGDADLSATVAATVSPADTTQNKFVWTSSNESVCKVYGGTNRALVVRTGVGEATLTGVNRYDPSLVVTCPVITDSLAFTVTNDLTNVTTSNSAATVKQGASYTATLTATGDYSKMTVYVKMGGVDVTAEVYADGVINIPNVSGNIEITAGAYSENRSVIASIAAVDSTTGKPKENSARMTTALTPVEGGTYISIISTSGYLIKAFEYGKSGAGFLRAYTVGGLDTATISGTLQPGCSHIRIVCKKSDNSDFTTDELEASVLKINNVNYALVNGNIAADIPDVITTPIDSADCACEIGSLTTSGTESENNARIRTDYIHVDGASGALGLAFTGVPHGAGFACRFYDSGKAFVAANSSDGWEAGGNATTFFACTTGWLDIGAMNNVHYNCSKVAYARFVFADGNGSTIDAADFANAAIIVDGHEYKLKFE